MQGIVEGWLELFLGSYTRNVNINALRCSLGLLCLDDKVVGCNATPCLEVPFSGAAQRYANLTSQRPWYIPALVTLRGHVLAMTRALAFGDEKSAQRCLAAVKVAQRALHVTFVSLGHDEARVPTCDKKRVVISGHDMPQAFPGEMKDVTDGDMLLGLGRLDEVSRSRWSRWTRPIGSCWADCV